MDSQINYIRQRLSLRKPLAKALELTARLTDKLAQKSSIFFPIGFEYSIPDEV